MIVFPLIVFALPLAQSAANDDENVKNPCFKKSMSEPKRRVCSQILAFRDLTKSMEVSKGRPTYLSDVDSKGGPKYKPGEKEAQLKEEDDNDKKEFKAKQEKEHLNGAGKGRTTTSSTGDGSDSTEDPIISPPVLPEDISKEETSPSSSPQDITQRKKRQTMPSGTVYDCMNIPCICGYMGGSMYTPLTCRLPDGSFYQKAVRKEFRMMTYAEMMKFQYAFWTARNSIYWMLSGFHGNLTSSPGAHSGPNFLPWHREFLKRFEIGMRTYRHPNGTFPYVDTFMPYWDSSMDDDVYKIFGVSSYNSSWFSEYLHGLVYNGQLLDGWFGTWSGRNGNTIRSLDGWPGQLTLFARSDLDAMVADPVVNNILAATAGDPNSCPYVPWTNLELNHGYVHVWMGGNMQYITQSTNDPIFFLHHCFIDFIWETWRLQNQNRFQRETQWSTAALSCYSPSHQQTATMLPFIGRVNQDGLSNMYTDYLYTYQLRPTCNATVSCGSPYLWCYMSAGRCVGRLKAGSTCFLVSGVDPCLASSCVLGKCVASG